MDVNVSNANYEQFNKNKNELSGVICEASEILNKLENKRYTQELQGLGAKVQNESFKIQVIGTFKNGKSTFINSLLGEKVLPAYSLPCTAIINEVKWGETKRAVLHFREDIPEKLASGTPADAIEHIKKHGGKNVPPIEIPYDRIRDYAVIPYGSDPREAILESPYEKIELFWPLPLLENGIEIIDSPGLNEHAVRTKVTMDYLSKADAILFVLTAQKICSADEMSFIENNLKNQGFTDPFFIVNRFDQIDEDEREDMKFFVNQKLGSYSTNEPFFVSGLKALEGKMQNDSAKYAESGMAELEERLSEFLTKEKGRAKLLQPANELKKIVGTETLTEVIPMQRKLLSSSLDEVKDRYEKEKPRLEDLKQRKAKVEMTLKLKIEQSKPIFKKALLASYESISSQVSAWVQEANPQTKLGILPNKEKFAAFGEEIVDFVNAKIEVQQAEWKKNVFEPLVTEKGTEIFTSLKEELKEFYQKVGEINVSLSGSDGGMNDASIEKKVSELLEGAGLSVSAEISDRYAKSIALEVGLGAVLTILGLLNPLTIGVMIGSVLFSRSKNERDIKNAVAAQIINSLTNESAAQSDAIADAVAAKLNELSSDIIKGLDAEITGMEDQVKLIIAELEKGQQAVDAKNKEIDVCEADAKLVCEKADALIEKIAHM